MNVVLTKRLPSGTVTLSHVEKLDANRFGVLLEVDDGFGHIEPRVETIDMRELTNHG